jgi:predicted secreted protein
MDMKMNRSLAMTGLMLFLTIFTAPAIAQTPPPPMPPEGQTILNISATEHTEVQQDILVASLRIDRKGEDPVALQNEINKQMDEALTRAKAVTAVQVSTGQYYVYPVDPEPDPAKATKTPRHWQGAQTLQLKSKDSAAILKLAGELQAAGLVMDDLSYMLSPEKAEETKDGLMERALAKVKAKADRAAKAMGKPRAEMVEVSIDASNQVAPPRPMMAMAMAKSADMQAPSAEPGQEQIDLTVSARVLLKP